MALFALLVGINQYKKEGIPPLYGPSRDVERLRAYLGSRYISADLHLLTLLNEAATKDAVVGGFREHLAAAGAGDDILFYFSGHGALEEVHPALRHLEQDHSFQTLVCYDSLSDTGATTLADKELRYLIGELSARCPRIAVVMDCCHSGESTRNAELILKRLSVNVPARAWQQFIFQEDIPEATARACTDMDELLPQGTHIQLAACEARQSAWEVRKAGIFTSGLLEVLQQVQGNISYHDLYSRVKYLLHKRFDQTPYLYIHAEDAAAYGHRFFLGDTFTSVNGHNANVSYNQATGSWLLDKGAMHGVQPGTDHPVSIYAASEGQPINYARVLSTQPGYSVVALQDASLPAGAYAARLSGLYRLPLNVLVAGEDTGVRCLQDFYLAQQVLFEQEAIFLITEPSQADYVVLARGNEYLVLRPHEYDATGQLPLRPVVRPVRGYEEQAAQQVLSYLMSIARWEFCKQLHNPHTSIAPFPITTELRINQDNEGGFVPADLHDGRLQASYLPLTPLPSLHFTFKLKNSSPAPYYCAALFLDISYKIHPGYLPGEVVYLEPAREQWVSGPKGLRFTQESFTGEQNLPHEFYYFLLMVSTERFEVSSLQQAALPLPLPAGMALRGDEPAVALARGASSVDTEPGSDWSTQLLTFQLLNPHYTS